MPKYSRTNYKLSTSAEYLENALMHLNEIIRQMAELSLRGIVFQSDNQ